MTRGARDAGLLGECICASDRPSGECRNCALGRTPCECDSCAPPCEECTRPATWAANTGAGGIRYACESHHSAAVRLARSEPEDVDPIPEEWWKRIGRETKSNPHGWSIVSRDTRTGTPAGWRDEATDAVVHARADGKFVVSAAGKTTGPFATRDAAIRYVERRGGCRTCGGPTKGRDQDGAYCIPCATGERPNPDASHRAPPETVRFTGGRTCAPETKCPYCNGPMGWVKLKPGGTEAWGCADPTWDSCLHYWALPTAAKPSRSNPGLILVTGNPAPPAEVERAWCRFHQADEFRGTVNDFGRIPGAPAFVFALGRCKDIDLGNGRQTFNPRPWLVCDPTDRNALWIVAPKMMNLGNSSRGRSVHSITYDPMPESGKEPAYYRHKFHEPRPTFAPIGSPLQTRAVLLDGGVYDVREWIED